VNGAVVVDTDVVSFLFKGDTRAEIYRQHLQGKTLAVSFMTVAELYQWAYVRNWGERRLARLEDKLRSYVVVPFDHELCKQ
jgi:tRNA(fMet)-specific endonuclease VapC